ncbi:hypothetical protein ACT8ZV_16215 [Nocardioides sp. MAHUQ-72]|uniref:hypothetical protein n=1 Tax=unclassified Nocardioides TaxID=2615069 RepID=UPI00361553CE
MDDTEAPGDVDVQLLEAMLNLTKYHREHEKFYGSSPREFAVVLQRHARSLQALADTWAAASPPGRAALSPYEGAVELNSDGALQLDGVLFMEGGAPPTEIAHLVRDLRTAAQDQREIGEWLATAMGASWDVASAVLGVAGLADVLGERHRIIANDWQAAEMSALAGRVLDRAADILDRVDFSAPALRADLAAGRVSVGLLYSAAEMVDHAADLLSDSAELVHGNERRWRVFRERVAAAVAAQA